jgi:hypothetical protein
MIAQLPVSLATRRSAKPVWTLTILLVIIGFAAALRRIIALFKPVAAVSGRFAAAGALDAGFAGHWLLTLLHVVPALLLIVLMPLQFAQGVRARHPVWHRWAGRAVIVLGFVVGTTALVMSYTMSIGGANETAATTFYAVLFLIFLSVGFWNIRHGRIARHREWMIRAFGVALGVATTRPIVAVFFAAGRLTPHEFFGIAFWLGFTITLVAAEAWIHYSAINSREARL